MTARTLHIAEVAASPGTRRSKPLVLMHGIFQRAPKGWRLTSNPVAGVERPVITQRRDPGLQPGGAAGVAHRLVGAVA